MPRKSNQQGRQAERDMAAEQQQRAWSILYNHPVLAPLAYRVYTPDNRLCPRDGWAVVCANGEIHVNEERLASPAEWCYVFAHCLLHLGFGHFAVQKYQQKEWNAACDCFVAQFLAELRLGKPPSELDGLLPALQRAGNFTLRSEEELFSAFCERGVPESLFPTGTAGRTAIDMIYLSEQKLRQGAPVRWQDYLAHGLEAAVKEAVDIAGGVIPHPSRAHTTLLTDAQRARSWFIANYPLLGALAASFTIIEDPLVCHRLEISVAAINMERKEIYINPRAGLTSAELRFVMAHELLHAGLRHDVRCGPRDFYLWNVACDYVVNSWLLEMGVGSLPRIGALYDPSLKGESAEAIYDRIAGDLRRYRKLSTLRGQSL
ncbi:MAG TPA: hypothetical protein VGN34_32450, partial [Ktedonobacteraceae bacterium]